MVPKNSQLVVNLVLDKNKIIGEKNIGTYYECDWSGVSRKVLEQYNLTVFSL